KKEEKRYGRQSSEQNQLTGELENCSSLPCADINVLLDTDDCPEKEVCSRCGKTLQDSGQEAAAASPKDKKEVAEKMYGKQSLEENQLMGQLDNCSGLPCPDTKVLLDTDDCHKKEVCSRCGKTLFDESGLYPLMALSPSPGTSVLCNGGSTEFDTVQIQQWCLIAFALKVTLTFLFLLLQPGDGWEMEDSGQEAATPLPKGKKEEKTYGKQSSEQNHLRGELENWSGLPSPETSVLLDTDDSHEKEVCPRCGKRLRNESGLCDC
ncbi:hypothetical protein E2320_014265, partial [Naja naja]